MNATRQGITITAIAWIAAALAGCAPDAPQLTRFAEPELGPEGAEGPPPELLAAGGCAARDESPAIFETVTSQVSEKTTHGGITRTHWRTETTTQIVEDRQDIWFPTICGHKLTPDFVASLQRALAARGHYDGPASGQMDDTTRAAIRRYQAPQGLRSGHLSLAAAQRLGLVVYDKADLKGGTEIR